MGQRALVLLGFMLVTLSLGQIMGVTHALSDLFEADARAPHCAERCPDEGESADFECPPFCPKCDCSHAGRPILPGASTRVVLALIELPRVLAALAPVWYYENPPLSSVFRPPRC